MYRIAEKRYSGGQRIHRLGLWLMEPHWIAAVVAQIKTKKKSNVTLII